MMENAEEGEKEELAPAFRGAEGRGVQQCVRPQLGRSVLISTPDPNF